MIVVKLLHVGDLHIGKSLFKFDLIEDQKYILQQIVNAAEKHHVDAVLLAGDIYDTSQPAEKAVNLLDWFLRELAQIKVKTFMISGNHDSDVRLNFGKSFFAKENIYIGAVFDGKLGKYTLEDEQGTVNIYLLPFIKASHVKQYFPEAEINDYSEAVAQVIEDAAIDTSERNVIVAHQFVAGSNLSTPPELAGSEGTGTISVGLVEQVKTEVFADFDYVALGHIHSPQQVGRSEVRYAGSILKYSDKDTKHEKSLPLITLGKKGEVKIELLPLKPLRDVRHIKGCMKEIIAKENLKDTDDYVYVTLQDEDYINDAMSIIQQYYPHAINLDYDNQHTRSMEQVEASQQEERSFKEIAADFYQQIFGEEITPEEMEILEAAAREAGITNEAN